MPNKAFAAERKKRAPAEKQRYPERITGNDKPSKAQSFFANVTTADDVRNLCDKIDCEGEPVAELELIMKEIFGS